MAPTTTDLQLWEILVPTVRPNKKYYRTRYHRVWDSKVRAIAGGLTILQPAKGQWISKEGDLYSERMIPVRVACTEEQIHDIAKMTKAYYEQLAVFYYCVSTKVFIYEEDTQC